jgi:hypothetical protein
MVVLSDLRYVDFRLPADYPETAAVLASGPAVPLDRVRGLPSGPTRPGWAPYSGRHQGCRLPARTPDGSAASGSIPPTTASPDAHRAQSGAGGADSFGSVPKFRKSSADRASTAPDDLIRGVLDHWGWAQHRPRFCGSIPSTEHLHGWALPAHFPTYVPLAVELRHPSLVFSAGRLLRQPCSKPWANRWSSAT